MNYNHATQLRTQAETTADPTAYMRAAAAFMLLNMPAAALRMLDRARHYKHPTPELTVTVQSDSTQIEMLSSK